MATRQPSQVTVMQTSTGGFRIRYYLGGFGNSSVDFEIECTAAQWKALLDSVGVAASVAAGTAGVETVLGGQFYRGGEIPANLAA